ncbi:MAG: hypothetical protein H7320_05210 [Ferruginibacter sp.]|nr:hypothetical protein [Ferruginibacter sp.]
MQAILATIISGFFSLAAIWYQNHLQKKNIQASNEPTSSKSPENKSTHTQFSSTWRIVFTLLIVICPLLLQLLIGKERLSGGDKYLMEYYLFWVVITFIATLIGWKKKSLFEKIILILSLAFLIFMTFEVMYETKRNANYQIDQIDQMNPK